MFPRQRESWRGQEASLAAAFRAAIDGGNGLRRPRALPTSCRSGAAVVVVVCLLVTAAVAACFWLSHRGPSGSEFKTNPVSDPPASTATDAIGLPSGAGTTAGEGASVGPATATSIETDAVAATGQVDAPGLAGVAADRPTVPAEWQWVRLEMPPGEAQVGVATTGAWLGTGTIRVGEVASVPPRQSLMLAVPGIGVTQWYAGAEVEVATGGMIVRQGRIYCGVFAMAGTFTVALPGGRVVFAPSGVPLSAAIIEVDRDGATVEARSGRVLIAGAIDQRWLDEPDRCALSPAGSVVGP